MKKLIIILLISIVNFIYSQTKIYAFVGKKISVERVKADDSFNLKYRNVYKVEQAFDEEIKTDTLVFNSYTHMNQIQYSVYDYAIIYLVKNEKDEFIHRRTYYTPIILKQNGKWYGFDSSDENIDEYEIIHDEYLNIRKNLAVGKKVLNEKIKNKWLVKSFYPDRFFIQINRNKLEIKYLKTAEKLLKFN
ncbi:hypothetical protein ASG01_12775 [Chryseobacterium sp. Leaf180]|uniref:hypothetical protein n=1 Tax=Chryseobacterium sp. Leaf180 TaxID=1736289 RepID=UPI0006F9B447|nr:hypothetical protein [Chryseobacterium sp. Leaf180]KQR91873.1 hypothetical protein ASG01_12775 [Chryseobacterium sp. Leaf180]